MAGSRLGWTFELDFNPILFDVVQDYPLYFDSFPDGDFPIVGQAIDFIEMNFPAVYSLKVTLIKGQLTICRMVLFSCSLSSQGLV